MKKYLSSIILGLNDALVEMLGCLIGYTITIDNSFHIGIIGLITGISACLSMSASEFLSSRYVLNKNPFKASLYVGISYLICVLLMVFPFFIFSKYLACILVFIVFSIIIIIFNYFISKFRKESFIKNLSLMYLLSLFVFFISFFISIFINSGLNVNI